MTATRISRRLESIIDAATPGEARQEAERHRAVLAHPDCESTLTRMIAEELEANGKSRFFALTRLSEYVGAIFRNTLRAGLTDGEPLPDLLVLAGARRRRTRICGRIRPSNGGRSSNPSSGRR